MHLPSRRVQIQELAGATFSGLERVGGAVPVCSAPQWQAICLGFTQRIAVILAVMVLTHQSVVLSSTAQAMLKHSKQVLRTVDCCTAVTHRTS